MWRSVVLRVGNDLVRTSKIVSRSAAKEASHREVLLALGEHFETWPAVADALGEAPNRVKSWRDRDSIPGAAYVTVAAVAQQAGIADVTVESLATYSNRKRRVRERFPWAA